jgi:hypothetical protein
VIDHASSTRADAGRPLSGVPWRRALAVLLAVALLAGGVVVALRADGFRAVDATVPRATRWFVDRGTDLVVLADGFSGRTIARLEPGTDAGLLDLAQGASSVALLDRSAGTARTIDSAGLRLGPPRSVELVSAPRAVFGVGQPGMVAVDPASSEAVLLPPGGDEVPFDVGTAGDNTRIAPDGAVWTLVDGTLARVTTTKRQVTASGLSGDARFTLVGNTVLVFDAGRNRVRLGDGDWQPLPAELPFSEVVLQEPGPSADCGWLGGDDSMWCVAEGGFEERATIPGLDIDGADVLAIAGNAAALVRRSPSTIVRIDWRAEQIITGDVDADVPDGAVLAVSASVDLLWIDEVDGASVWAVHPWGINRIDKSDTSSPLLGETGEVLEPGDAGTTSGSTGTDDSSVSEPPEPDDDGIDDPPVAVDDPVTARAAAAVPIEVTANDYDPDGEAIAVVEVSDAAHGTVDIVSASTVSYLPEAAFVGRDQFTYTIVDGNGTQDSATVSIELLALDAPNQAPIGSPDSSETAMATPVVIDVLLNDVDPERDALRVASFTPPDTGGTVTETVAPSGLPALRFEPEALQSGRVRFSYRPIDSFGAIGEPVDVEVEVARADDANRPPELQPDAVRTRRDVPARVPVLLNDRDPDGDRMSVGVVEPLPPGLDVRVVGTELEVVARAGVQRLTPFTYTVDDGRDHTVRGSVLVVLIDDVEPNRPPIANADSHTAVVGTSTLIDVLANDIDPDNDTMFLIDVDHPEGAGGGSVERRGNRVAYVAGDIGSVDDAVLDRFTYTVTDGNGHNAVGQVTVRVLAEPIAAPPFARDDSATTQTNVPVTLDVLLNDGDPSGEQPTIFGTPGCAGGGSARVTSEGRVTFTPPEGQTGVFSCSYEVVNSQGLRAGAVIIVNVIAPPVSNQPPTVFDEEVNVVVGGQLTIDVLSNDTDPDGPNSALRVVSITTPSLGTATRDGSVITFDAGPTAGITTIIYQVADDAGDQTAGRLTIRISEPDPLPPLAVDDRATIVGPGGSFAFAVLANDDDPDGSPDDLRLGTVTVTAGEGTASVSGRNVTLTADSDFVGDLVASYVVIDGTGLSDTGEIVLSVMESPNRPPVALDDFAQVASGGTVTLPISLNDSDPDGDAVLYTITTPPDPSLGSARLDGGSLIFQSSPGAAGTAVVRYTIDDGEFTDTASATVTVLPCAQAAPFAPDVFLQTGYQQPIFVDLTTVAANGEIVAVDPPLGAPSGVYTPPAGENGNITFSYTVRNACRLQAVGLVTIDVNQDPIGSAYSASIGRTQPITIPLSVLASDNEPLTIGALEGAPGWIAIVDSGRAVLVDPRGSSGSVDLTAVIVDPGGLQVRVPISIELVNLAPVAGDDVVRIEVDSVTFDPLQNDTDPDGDAIALQSVPQTIVFSNGVEVPIVRLSGDQLLVIAGAARGTASFDYTIVDALGLVSQPATVTITINSPPLAPDVEVLLAAGTSTMTSVNASDPDGEPLTLTIDDDPSPLTIEVDGLVLTIRAPLAAASTTYDLDYTVTDDSGGSATGSLLITVTEPSSTTSSTTSTTMPTSTTTTTIGP